jgi:hypothetical protein
LAIVFQRAEAEANAMAEAKDEAKDEATFQNHDSFQQPNPIKL